VKSTPTWSGPVDQLVGVAEVAQIAGVSHAAVVTTWMVRHPSFPQPITRIKAGPIFDRRHVERWLRDTGRIPA